MSISRFLAEYITTVDFEDIPAEVIRQTKRLILDSLGCAFGGYKTRPSKILLGFVTELGGREESTLIGDGVKVPCKHAAFANSHIATLLDFDETYCNIGHPGSRIVHSAIAMAARNESSGKDLITAVVVGYEVATRIARAQREPLQLPSSKKLIGVLKEPLDLLQEANGWCAIYHPVIIG